MRGITFITTRNKLKESHACGFACHKCPCIQKLWVRSCDANYISSSWSAMGGPHPPPPQTLCLTRMSHEQQQRKKWNATNSAVYMVKAYHSKSAHHSNDLFSLNGAKMESPSCNTKHLYQVLGAHTLRSINKGWTICREPKYAGGWDRSTSNFSSCLRTPVSLCCISLRPISFLPLNCWCGDGPRDLWTEISIDKSQTLTFEFL